MTILLDKLTGDDFESAREHPFAVEVGARDIEFLVHQVTQRRDEWIGAGQRAPFSVVLRAPESPPLEQGIYVFRHPRLGHLELFIVPIAQTGGFRDYEACFN